MKRMLLWIIKFYRKGISPLTPPSCRFIPTCSEYALQAIERYGVWKGGWLTIKRLSKCHPFHKQESIEYDPVP